ncbi:hypothetical protein DEA98_05910 [Brucella pseudogrignonensis]|nr:hypothetical protein [Brucella pseudogrignonensis]
MSFDDPVELAALLDRWLVRADGLADAVSLHFQGLEQRDLEPALRFQLLFKRSRLLIVGQRLCQQAQLPQYLSWILSGQRAFPTMSLIVLAAYWLMRTSQGFANG